MLAVLTAGALLAAAILPFAGVGGWAVSASTETMNSNLQDITENNTIPLTTRVTDRDGKTLAWLYEQNRTEVPSEKISQAMKDSIVAIEDRRFYEHGGVDMRGTMRALVSNLTSGGVAEGASTINQQYVKNYLWLISAQNLDEQNAAIETSIPRKLREMKMAADLENELSKDDILTRYLNLVSFGNGAYGVQAAARTYFGVNAEDLNDTQAAFLAGVVQSTSALNPYTNPEGATFRRNAVLQARVAAGTLSQAEADALAQEPLGVGDAPRIPPNGCIGAGDAGFFCDYVLGWLDEQGYSREEIAAGGYTIKTTLDASAQEAAENAARANVDPHADGVAAATNYVVPRKDTHEVVAMAASRDYGLEAGQHETVLPLTHSLQGHGAGSIFKIFAAAAALQDGLGLDSNLAVPKRVEVEGMGDGGAEGCPPGKYCVENATNYKPSMTLREALATSPNTPFIKIAEQVGLERIVDLSVKMGLRSYTKEGSYDGENSIADYVKKANLGSYVLGPTSVDPLELSNVAATLADNGRWCEPTPVLSVTDRNGQPLKLEKKPCEQALDRGVANALANGMGSDVSTGTASGSAAAEGWGGPISAKTGTTETSFSAAFLGFTPGWAGSAYIFNDGGTPANLCTSPVRQCGNGDLYGGNEPARVFFSTSVQEVGSYGGARLPSYDPVYNRGTNPGAWSGVMAPRASSGAATGGASGNDGRNTSAHPAPPVDLGQFQLPPDIQQGLDDLLRQFQP
ncbi:MAG TPA: penicillin-binding protein [Candidatus Corynebacterium gallistercoris]|uniref:Penicillin-binding protein n=1 Tax=Candidatus Corynebacterium gallistercoris TaxID=2838530 RepID=A0A9D1RYL5_9CORY|nr:penicillin-binding protein [Candidatus Corynebacterium gallistercoris]